jgi:hypothetical protein
MTNKTHYPSQPMPKGRPGQLGYVRVRLLYSPIQPDNAIAVTPVDSMGRPIEAHAETQLFIDAGAIMTAREAAEAARKGGVQ